MSDLLDTSGNNPWLTESSSVIYENGHLRFRVDRVVQPDGQPGEYAFLDLPHPVVGIVPLSDDGCVHLVRQWRYPWGRNSWEIPAGHGEVNETPLAGAQRELAEEAGLRAACWEPLGTGFGSAGVNAFYHLYLARGLSPATDGAERDGAEEDLITRPIPLREAIEAAMDGRIVHAFTVIGLLRTARRLGV
jgi:8-oxo-dGTP pyrophosphatase MutT (NUDIX family)